MRNSLRPDLSVLPRTLLVRGAWLVALALSAWIAASWYWQLTAAPVISARPAPLNDPLAAAQEISSRQLFGTPPVAQEQAAAAAAPVQNLVLIGVSTKWGKLPGFAIIRDGANPAKSFIEGEESSSGTRLMRVLADAVEIERNGARERIALSTSATASPAAPPAGTQQQNASNPPGSASAPPADE